jgi:uncharacterized membrane protein (UPF0182 family)
MPELRLVVLALEDRLAYGPNFATALAALFGNAPSSVTAAEQAPASAAAPPASVPVSGGGQAAGAAKTAPDTNALIAQAARDLDDYQRLTSEGKLGEAGQKLEDLKRVLGELNARSR